MTRSWFRAVTPEQEKIAEWFCDEAPPLGELYKAAVRLLEDRTFPARTHFICHAAREIGNRVPEVIAGRTKFQRVELTEELDQLAELWSRNSLDRNELTQSAAPGTDGAATAAHAAEIPIEVFRHLHVLVNHHSQGHKNNLQKAARMIEAVARENAGRQETLVPLARQWVELTRWFHGRTHAGFKETVVDEHELQSKFQLLETYLYTFIGEFYEAVGALDAILEDTNS